MEDRAQTELLNLEVQSPPKGCGLLPLGWETRKHLGGRADGAPWVVGGSASSVSFVDDEVSSLPCPDLTTTYALLV